MGKWQPSWLPLWENKYARLYDTLSTRYPNLKPEDGRVQIKDSKNKYTVSGDGNGSMIIHKIEKL